MGRRTLVIFWGAVAAAVFLLGSGVSSVRAELGGGGIRDLVLLAISLLGLGAALLVAGRIVFVAARLQRRARKP